MSRAWENVIPTDMTALYKEAGFAKRTGFGKRPAVLVVDMQYSTIGDAPEPVLQSIKKYPSSAGEVGWASVSKIGELLSVARAKKVPIIYTRYQREPYDKDVWKPKMSTKLSQTVISTYDQKGKLKATDFIKEIAPLEKEIIVTKKRTSSFFGTTLVSYLNSFEADTLIITGGVTSSCVHNTVVDANQYNYRVIVVEECVFDRHPFIHAVSLFDLDAKWCDVVSLEEVKTYIEGIDV